MLNGDGTCYVILTNNSVLHKVATVESIEDGEQLCEYGSLCCLKCDIILCLEQE